MSRNSLPDAKLARLILIRLEAIRDARYGSKAMARQALLDAIADCKIITSRYF